MKAVCLATLAALCESNAFAADAPKLPAIPAAHAIALAPRPTIFAARYAAPNVANRPVG